MKGWYNIGILFLLFSMVMMPVVSFSGEINLNGEWKFKIGDNSSWADPGFNDAGWSSIQAPSPWEDQGYRGYDGYAWYRKTIAIDKSFQDQDLILQLGYIDDIDEVFVNGQKIGQSGSFPPSYWTAYNALRKYSIPGKLLKFGQENLIAIRVYDSQLEGGIVNGNLKIYSVGKSLKLDVDLSGTWMWNKGMESNPSQARPIIVPGVWENQGINYDGYAIYITKFNLPNQLVNERLVLLAGRIDDVDRVYINGQYVGSTGDYINRVFGENYREFRNYFISPGSLKAGENIIEIKVYDEHGDGGIVQGPIGILTQQKFREYWKSKRKN